MRRRLLCTTTAALAVVVATVVPAVLAASATAASAALPVTAVSASGDDGNVPADAVDGDLTTRWSDEGDGVWLNLDLGANRDLGAVSIAWYRGDIRQSQFMVQTADADSPSSWTTVVSRRGSSGDSTAPQTYDFTDRNDRYLRVVGYGNDSNDWTSISEIAVLGAGSATPTLPGGCTYPAQVLNLTNWEMTLPTGQSENPDDVYQPDCAPSKRSRGSCRIRHATASPSALRSTALPPAVPVTPGPSCAR